MWRSLTYLANKEVSSITKLAVTGHGEVKSSQ